jgi:hypothetical protein
MPRAALLTTAAWLPSCLPSGVLSLARRPLPERRISSGAVLMAAIRVSTTLLLLALTLGLAGSTAAQLSAAEYIPLTPCGVFDSRGSSS